MHLNDIANVKTKSKEFFFSQSISACINNAMSLSNQYAALDEQLVAGKINEVRAELVRAGF